MTLVDCPGHASLIRTIIGGANIIDMMILVIDATKAGFIRVIKNLKCHKIVDKVSPA